VTVTPPPPPPLTKAAPLLHSSSPLIIATTSVMANYDKILEGKYPAKKHARKVAAEVLKRGGDEKGTIYVEGQKSKYWEVCRLKLRNRWAVLTEV
jgi:hypothetical protein